MRVRAATISDIPRIIELAKVFRKESSIHHPEVDGDWIREIAPSILSAENVCVFVVEEQDVIGLLCASAFPALFSRKIIATTELFFVDPERRSYRAASMLFDKFKEWARDKGCYGITLGIRTGKDFGMFLKRKGLRFSGENYEGLF